MTDDPDAPEPLDQYLARHEPIPELRKALIEYWHKEEKRKTERREFKQRQQDELDRTRHRNEREAIRNRERQEAEALKNPEIHPFTYQVEIPDEIRDQHIFIPGRTRHGKSTELLRIIITDIQQGHGIAVLDPKGDLIRRLCALLPPHRIADCIYLDLTNPIPLDVMRRPQIQNH